MTSQYDFGFFGGDNRQVYMAKALLLQGYSVATYCLASSIQHVNHIQVQTLSDLFEQSKVLIGPIPMTRDQVSVVAKTENVDLTISHVAFLLKAKHVLIAGNIPSVIEEQCKAKGTSSFDLMKDEKITILNAIATAEGTIMEAILSSPINLHGSNSLVIGYGRCGKVLAHKLKALDSDVTVAARSGEALSLAHSFGHRTIHLLELPALLPSCDYIFNTVPTLILDRNLLNYVNKEATIIDIASAPGGVDFDYARQLNLTAKLSLGLPGKVSPKTSATIIVTEILSFLKERSD